MEVKSPAWAGPTSGTATCGVASCPLLRRALCLVLRSAVVGLKFLISEHGTLHFDFVPGPTNYVAYPESGVS